MKNKFKPQRFRIFQDDNNIIISIEKTNLIIDIKELLPTINNHTKQHKQSLDEYDVFISFYGTILTGSKEIESNPLFFGELDSKDSNMGLNTNKPIYYLQNNEYALDSSVDSNINFTSQDIENNIISNKNNSSINSNKTDSNHTTANKTYSHAVSTSTLQIFFNNSTLTILNYSILESSLNIKLESTSQESKTIIDKQKALINKIKQSQINKSISTALLHPILEDNILKCPHNGIVKLKSIKGKPFKSNLSLTCYYTRILYFKAA